MDDYAEDSQEQGRKPQKQTNSTHIDGDQIIVNIKAISSPKQSTMPAAPKQERRGGAQSRMNEKYREIITKESETVKHLFKMLSPKMANFAKAKREIEPYDDINELRQ